ncbi:GM19116 [Drosophila sechellia]|uniref:GM19116 n=1 Tax=Drosophila sechellia TaxID=7238 RepID=B4I9A7_DROSE|nr:GM19116 [Drosophila sechellia]
MKLHSVLGISYYYYFRESPGSAAPLCGAWLFSACVVTLLHGVRMFPKCPARRSAVQEWESKPFAGNESSWASLLLETGVCCLVLDLTLSKLWHRIESLCQCAIVGILQALAVEEQTFLACEYWTLGLTTGLIGGCLLWLSLWATALPQKLRCGMLDWRRTLHRRCSALIFGSLEPGTPMPTQSQGSAQSFAT